MENRIAAWGLTAVCGLALLVSAGCVSRQTADRLQGKINDLGAENEALKAENQKLRGQLADLENQQKGLEGKLSSAESQAEAAQRKLAELQEKLKKYGFDVTRRGGQIIVTLPQKILFLSGSARVRQEAMKGLEAVADVLKKEFPGKEIHIEGNTDSDPIKHSGWEDNWQLSGARARSVLHVLLKGGVEPQRLSFSGCAFYKPVAPNTTPQGKQRNRRVEVVILPGGESAEAAPAPAGAGSVKGTDAGAAGAEGGAGGEGEGAAAGEGGEIEGGDEGK